MSKRSAEDIIRNESVPRALMTLAVPTVLEHILTSLLQYVDTAMVGALGEEATASVSLSTTITWLTNSIPYAVALSLLALISRAIGAKEYDKVKKLSANGIILGLIFTVVLLVTSLIISPFLPVWMGAEDNIRESAKLYYIIITLPMLFRVSTSICSACVRATGDTKNPMFISVGSNILNIVLNYVLIYMMGMGVVGAAMATAACYTLSGILMFVLYTRTKQVTIKLSQLKADKESLREIGKMCMPLLGTNIASCSGYVVFAGLVSSMGTTTFAAHSIAVTAEELFYIPGYGLRTATTTMVGFALGQQDMNKLKKTARYSTVITLLMMFVSGAVLFFAAGPLMSIFTPSKAVIDLGARMLKIVAFSEPFFGLMIVMEGIYYGLGKTKEAFIIETGSMWGVRIVSTFIVVKLLHLPLAAVWLCMIADNIVKAVSFAVLYRRKIAESFTRKSI